MQDDNNFHSTTFWFQLPMILNVTKTHWYVTFLMMRTATIPHSVNTWPMVVTDYDAIIHHWVDEVFTKDTFNPWNWYWQARTQLFAAHLCFVLQSFYTVVKSDFEFTNYELDKLTYAQWNLNRIQPPVATVSVVLWL